MNPSTLKLDSGVIIYDAEAFPGEGLQPDAEWFDPHWWEEQGLVGSRQRGRGTALFLKTPIGRAVLRQYLRGGLAARFIQSNFLFTGFGRSRPVREFRVLEKLARLGLPAPRPLAGLCARRGLRYTGALLTREIENVRTLENVLDDMDEKSWCSVGVCIRRFHDHGLVHADLTVRNILIQEGGAVFLVDFDRARFREGANRAFAGNLKRFRRSLLKSWLDVGPETIDHAWTHLLNGYESSTPGA